MISAIGEQVESELFTANGIEVDAIGLPAFQTNLEGVYAGGDARRGPATVVEGIADARPLPTPSSARFIPIQFLSAPGPPGKRPLRRRACSARAPGARGTGA